MFSEERIDTFFLIGRRRSAAWDFFFFLSLAIVGQLVSSVINMQRFGFRNSERLFAEVVASARAAGGGGLGALAPTPPAASAASAGVATAPEVAAATTVVLRDLGGREPEARPDLVGDDLDDVAPVAVAVLVAALLEAAGDDDARALRERLAHVLGHLAPAHDVEEARRLLPLVGVAVHPASVHRHAEARVRRAARRVAELGIAGQVAHDRDRVAVRHGVSSLCVRRAGARRLRGSVDPLRNVEHLVTEYLVSQGEHPVQLLHRLRLGPRLKDHVVALRAVVDLVGEAPLPPVVDGPGLGALRLDELEEPVDRGPDRLLFQVRVEDDHDLVRPQGLVPPVDRDLRRRSDGLPAAPGEPDGKEQAELEQFRLATSDVAYRYRP